MPRITEEAKQATRKRILDTALSLFKSKGFEQATTRDIANEAGIAAGTLFNYFPAKEDIVMALVTVALARAAEEFAKQKREGASLEEDLFLNVSTGLRRLKPYRRYVGPVLETTLSPMVASASNEQAQAIRVAHLERVQEAISSHGQSLATWTIAMQLYWTLYTGVLAFWVNDSSPKQEDTLAMLDQSISMFVSWLKERGNG
ncbi:MAG: TetR/AcrR family transcriptional regulator [Planctomycetes bacterium]|nr:TetR/AcrR family transcriptional regulator [Planctomycetota bacterium]